ADLRRVEGVQRIALDGLVPDEVAEVLTAAAGHNIGDAGTELAAQIAQETDGNPFFVGEILQHLTESGALAVDADGRWRLHKTISELGLPQSVRDVVGRRIDRLGEEPRHILAIASVIGRTFDLELLTRLLDQDEDEILDALDTALEASVLTESPERVGRFSFSHALINNTLYEQQSATRRARMHKRIAEALEELYGADPGDRLPELANHFSRAVVAADHTKAQDYARRAGDRALEQLAPEQALRWLNQALELIGQDAEETERCELLIGIGTAQRDLGDPEFRATLLEAAAIARRTGNVSQLVRATLANTRGYHAAAGVVDSERVDGLEAAIAAVDASSPDRPILLALLAGELTFSGESERIKSLADEALASARTLEDPRRLVRALQHVVNTPFGSADTAHTFWELTGELQTRAEELADPFLLCRAFQWRFIAAMQLGEAAEMDRALARARELADQIGQPLLDWVNSYLGSAREQFYGRLEAAEALALRAAGIGHESGQPDALMMV
ncbi:MAG: ATP-binding protein, partial [Pseudonocardiaceae bacterium]